MLGTMLRRLTVAGVAAALTAGSVVTMADARRTGPAVAPRVGEAVSAAAPMTSAAGARSGAVAAQASRPAGGASHRPAGGPSGTPSKDPHHGAGYEGPHTAWAADRGLRLVLETHDNGARAGVPDPMTVTLQNLTDHDIVVGAPRDCVVAVGARPAGGSGDDGVAACAGSGHDPRGRHSGEMQKVLVPARGSWTSDAALAYPREGGWEVAAVCMCFDGAHGPSKSPAPRPVVGVPALPSGVSGSSGGASDTTASSYKLMTPPIKVAVA